jgi:hypothetical protein
MLNNDVCLLARNVGFELLVDNSTGNFVVSTPEVVCDITEKLKAFAMQVEELAEKRAFDKSACACLRNSKDIGDLAHTCATEINKIANKKKVKPREAPKVMNIHWEP